MGLAWQQGPLAAGAIGTFLVAEPLPERLLYAEPLRRRMKVVLGGQTIAESDDVTVLHEPGRYPVAYFLKASVRDGALVATDRRSDHPGLGTTAWYEVRGGDRRAPRGAWEHVELASHNRVLEARVAFAWTAMDEFYEEDERIVGHAADAYHRIDIRRSARHMTVSSDGTPLLESDPRSRALRIRVRGPLVRAAQRHPRRVAGPRPAHYALSPTRGSAATTTSPASPRRPGHTSAPIRRWRASTVTCRSSPTSSRSRSVDSACTPRPVSTSSPTGRTAI